MFRNPLAVPSRQVGAAALLIAAVIILTTGASQWQNYHRTEARVERDTRNIARLLAEHAGQTFRGIEETMRAVGRLRRDVTRGIYRSQARSEERRVGKECVSPCRYRWSPDH